MASAVDESTIVVDDIREIFRKVSPYIIRQWREVCLKLGLQELELVQFEMNGYHSSKAHLAFKALCLWYDRVGKSATKEKLVSALKHCGLHRAEEEIEQIELQKLKISSNLIRPLSRQHTASPSLHILSSSSLLRNQSAAKRKSIDYQRETSGCGPRQPSRAGSSSSTRRLSNSRGRQSYSNKTENSCELCFKITVSHIQPQKETTGMWREKFKEMAANFYDAILTNPELHMTALENAIGNPELSAIGIQGESLLVRLKVLTLGALESLNQMYKTRRLLAICESVFVTDNSLKTIGAKNIGIKVELSTDVLDQCRDFFLSRKFKENIHPTDTLSAPSFESQPSLDSTTSHESNPCMHDVFNEKWRNRMMEDVQRIEERNAEFDETMDEYLRTLNIIMPKDKIKIQSLSDLLQLYSYLNKTYGVSSGVRVDLFREYLLIVNSIRLIVEEIQTKLLNTVESDNSFSDDVDDFSVVKCLVDDLQLMLQVDTNFEEDLSALNRKISPSEKPFTGLICFIPLLLAKLSTVLFTLTPTVHEPGNLSE